MRLDFSWGFLWKWCAFQHSTYMSFLLVLLPTLKKFCWFFPMGKYLRSISMMLFVGKKPTYMIFLFFSESYCLSLSFWLIWQTSQAHDEGRIFPVTFLNNCSIILSNFSLLLMFVYLFTASYWIFSRAEE